MQELVIGIIVTLIAVAVAFLFLFLCIKSYIAADIAIERARNNVDMRLAKKIARQFFGFKVKPTSKCLVAEFIVGQISLQIVFDDVSGYPLCHINVTCHNDAFLYYISGKFLPSPYSYQS